MKLETTFRHAHSAFRAIHENSFTKRCERRLERRLANAMACDEASNNESITCASSSTIVEEGEKYCRYCKSYWQDVENGLFGE